MNAPDYLALFNKTHNGKYTYHFDENTKLISSTKITITCPEHGNFTQLVSNHKRGAGCKPCGQIVKGLSRKITHDEFISKSISIHGSKYDYSKVQFSYNSDKIVIGCPHHGDFELVASLHYTKREQGCPKCTYEERSKQKRSTPEYIENQIPDVIKQYYLYDLSTYKNSRSFIEVTCTMHNITYLQNPRSFIKGNIGCVKCNTLSLGELKIKTYLEQKNISFIQQHSFDKCIFKRKLKFDFYLPEWNACIEFDGRQHYVELNRKRQESLNIIQARDATKNNFCLANNILLLRIPYWDSANIEKILESYFI